MLFYIYIYIFLCFKGALFVQNLTYLCTIFRCHLQRFLDNENILKRFQIIVNIILFFPSTFLHTQRRRKIKGTWMKDSVFAVQNDPGCVLHVKGH